LEIEVNERRLHAGKYLRDAALVDIADNASRGFPLDENFDDVIVLEDRHPCFVARRGDDHLLVHSRNSCAPGHAWRQPTPVRRGRRACRGPWHTAASATTST